MTFPSPMPEHILAIDRLNSWVRSESYRKGHWHSSPFYAIYWLKGQAIEWADNNLTCQHEHIRAMVVCRGCSGTGKYYDSNGYTWPHCRACSSTGRHSLMFVETRIQNGPTWHIPHQKFFRGYGKPSIPWELARVAEDWKPNQVGRDMTVDEVARDLNTAEMYFTKRPHVHETDWGERNDFAYKLYVGNTGKVCAFCGDNAEQCGYGVSFGRISWTDYACKKCAEPYPGVEIFSRFPLPIKLIDFPNIQAWIARNSTLMERPIRHYV